MPNTPVPSAAGSRTTLAGPLAALCVLVFTWLAFQPALDADLLSFDDDQALTLNPHFRGLGREQLAWMATTPRLGHYQPLTWLSFALQWSPTEGLVPERYHRVNVLLHMVAALAFLALAHLLLTRALRGPPSPWTWAAAGVAAALFAVHPLRAESVAWVTERRDVLSAPFFLAALVAWMLRARSLGAPCAPGAAGAHEASLSGRSAAVVALCSGLAVALFFATVDLDERGATLRAGPAAALVPLALIAAALPGARSRGGRWYGLALLAMLLSLTAKAWGIVLPALLLVLDAWPLGRLRARRDLGPLLVEKLPFFSLTVVFAALARWAQASQGGTMKTLSEHSLLERLLQGGYGLVWYPLKTFVPRALAPIYELPERLNPGDPRFLVPTLVAVAVTALVLALRRRRPALCAAWLAFVIIVSPVLGVAQSGPQLVADRYSYLSCLPFALLVAGGWLALVRRGGLARTAGTVIVAGVLAGGFALTRAQLAHWKDDAALWERALAVDPDSYAAHLQLARVRVEQGLLDEALELYERGFELEDDPRFLEGQGRVFELRATLASDPARRAELFERALEYARRTLALALETDRFFPEYRYNYGTSLWNVGRQAEALEHLRWYAENQPAAYLGRLTLGRVLLAQGRAPQARDHLEAAAALEPLDPAVWRALARLHEALGQPARASSAWNRVLALDPNDLQALEARASRPGG